MSQQDAFALYMSGSYGRALARFEEIRTRRELSIDEAICHTELLSLTGAVERAISSARQLRKDRRLTAVHRCRLADVLGLSYFRIGETGTGTIEYKRAIDVAHEHNEPEVECRLRVHLFRNEVRWCGPPKAVGELTQLRRKVNHLATAALSVKFHLGLADLASKLALLPRARKHLETARALLPNVEDQAIHADVLLGNVVLTALESDVVGALKLVTELAPMAEQTGSESLKFGAVVNMAHLLVLQQRYDEALRWLEGAITDRQFGGGSIIAVRDTLTLLHLSRGSHVEARFQLDQITALLEKSDGADSWLGLAHLLHRVKWHYAVGDSEGGLALALDAIPRIESISGRSVLTRMQLLAAEGMGRTGRIGEATALVAAAVNSHADAPLETVAEFHRVTGRLCASDDAQTSKSHFDRAIRILDGVGNLAARAEVTRDAIETIGNLANDQSVLTVKESESITSELSRRIALLGELGAHPRLLAREVHALLVDTGAILSAAILETSSSVDTRGSIGTSGPSESTIEGSVPIRLGHQRDQEWLLAVVPKPTPSARTTVLAVEQLVRNAVALARTRQQDRERAVLWPEHTPEEELGLVCASERMLEVVKTIHRFAATGFTVLITGETGVGKELFARALHRVSSRTDKSFLPFNCSTVPKDMLDSQLFGHRKGAFTGAHETGIGVIRAADGGTLFLDEIGEMTMEAQPKLLRFLESGEIHPLGEAKPVHVDVRIVAATNANLEQLVGDGKFREDLFYRLNVLPIHIPPLRERREEVPALVEHFVDKFGREMQKPMMRVADETLEYLLLYRWPGNVRQLANEIRRMVALAEPGAMLTPAHLSAEIISSRRTIPVEPSQLVMRLDQPLADATDQLERAAIERALTAANGNNDQAAKLLGLSRKGLYLKRQRLGLK